MASVQPPTDVPPDIGGSSERPNERFLRDCNRLRAGSPATDTKEVKVRRPTLCCEAKEVGSALGELRRKTDASARLSSPMPSIGAPVAATF